MAKNKLRRFREMKEWSNVFEPTLSLENNEEFELKGNWNKNYFQNENPIVLELGCGKGEYAIGLAKHFSNKNFIGMDIKGARIWVGAKDAVENGIENVAFLRSKIDFITTYFAPAEVDEIWLTFSDPQPLKPRKRLTSKSFIDRYRQVLKPGGIIHLKTDSDLLFESTLEEIEEHGYNCLEKTWNLYGEIPDDLDARTKDILHIKTHYENLFTAKGFDIKYCQFKID
ncbi:MAG: tRNA (guanosine(46)-N7)-methyltransferase TrmB [Crocinitomicaceae bacterium]|nr:tRNA (guanosine(46)-N7)-methyltransferase TrmB [Crocinitomicaceae bacterium]